MTSPPLAPHPFVADPYGRDGHTRHHHRRRRRRAYGVRAAAPPPADRAPHADPAAPPPPAPHAAQHPRGTPPVQRGARSRRQPNPRERRPPPLRRHRRGAHRLAMRHRARLPRAARRGIGVEGPLRTAAGARPVGLEPSTPFHALPRPSTDLPRPSTDLPRPSTDLPPTFHRPATTFARQVLHLWDYVEADLIDLGIKFIDPSVFTGADFRHVQVNCFQRLPIIASNCCLRPPPLPTSPALLLRAPSS